MAVTEQVSEQQARQVAEQAREAQWRQPSFGKELFLGRLRLDLVHPHPSGSAEAAKRGEAFLDRLRDFCDSQIDAAAIERDAQIPDKVVRGLKELGAFGMKIATEYGGVGLSQVYYNKALALVGSVHPSLGALLSAHQSIGVPQPITMFGTEEQKRTWLPRCTQEISAFLLTEPDVGSDPARLHATATPDGDDYVLNGVKLWTTNGVIADLLVVMAQVPESEGHRGGITAFVVEADAPGIVVENRNAFMGLRGIENGAHPVDRRAGTGREPDRPRRRRAADRAVHAERGAVVAAGGLYRVDEMVFEDRQGVVSRAGAMGPAARRARSGGWKGRVHRGHHLRAGGDARACQ